MDWKKLVMTLLWIVLCILIFMGIFGIEIAQLSPRPWYEPYERCTTEGEIKCNSDRSIKLTCDGSFWRQESCPNIGVCYPGVGCAPPTTGSLKKISPIDY